MHHKYRGHIHPLYVLWEGQACGDEELPLPPNELGNSALLDYSDYFLELDSLMVRAGLPVFSNIVHINDELCPP
jgi:hypothetical protein